MNCTYIHEPFKHGWRHTCKEHRYQRFTLAPEYEGICPITETKMTIQEMRIPRFLKALSKFLIEGKGRFLPKEKILERFEVCKLCPHFTGRHCKHCGCFCHQRRKFLNKLSMPTEECPEGRWKREL